MSSQGTPPKKPGRGATPPKGPEPPTPGSIIWKYFIEPFGISKGAFARAADVQPSDLSLLLGGRRALTAPVAIRVAKATRTSPVNWKGLQTAHDLWAAGYAIRFEVDVEPHLRALRLAPSTAYKPGLPWQPPHPPNQRGLGGPTAWPS